jgi:hypothetical protein
MQSACFQTGCSSDARYLYSLGGAVLVLCEAHGDAYEQALAARAVPVYTLGSLGDVVSVGNAFASCCIKVVGASREDRTNLALRNLRSDLEQLRERDPELTSKLDLFVACLSEEPQMQDQERQGCIELVAALVRGRARPDVGILTIPLALSDAVASTLRAHEKLSRVWDGVTVALREGSQQTR